MSGDQVGDAVEAGEVGGAQPGCLGLPDGLDHDTTAMPPRIHGSERGSGNVQCERPAAVAVFDL